MRLVLDVENEAKEIAREGKTSKLDLLPFSGKNSLVSVGLKNIDTGESLYVFFKHNELVYDPERMQSEAAQIQDWLNRATLLIGHYIKHDIIWMRECGFEVPRIKFWDTAIAEYCMHRGQTKPLSLEELSVKHNLPRKKVDLTQQYLDQGIGFEAMPIGIVEEYGRGDLDATEALFHHQVKRLETEEYKPLVPTVGMMNEFMYVLAKWQANGIKIDLEELKKVRAQYVLEQASLKARLEIIARSVLGDTPLSLSSNDDKSMLIYSRTLKDKKTWKRVFNLGTDDNGKALRRPWMKPHEFQHAVRSNTEIAYRTRASQCQACGGLGRVTPNKKDGSPGKAKRICKPCSGVGIIYTPTTRIAGFKCQPKGVKEVAAHGFCTDADKIEELAKTAQGEAKEFLEKLSRLNAVNVYISTFCDGILNNVTKDLILYTNFNQCITATGRLSSTDPNFQNQPRGKTFPVRRAIVSRFKGGKIVEGDFAQLEFRVAGELSDDKQVLADLLNKVDAHAFTRDTLCAAGMVVDRQDAKPHTFKPLYGGEYGTEAEMAYYRAFKAKFKGVATWQRHASELVLSRKVYTLPSGRQYCWPRAERKYNGKIDFFTQIVNYPVQGFATADIVPIACIILDKEFERRQLKSIPFLTVHDSIAVDAHPEELEIIPKILADCMLKVKEDMLTRYKYNFTMPLEIEVKMGDNWLDSKVVLKQETTYTAKKSANDDISKSKQSDTFHDDPLPEFMAA